MNPKGKLFWAAALVFVVIGMCYAAEQVSRGQADGPTTANRPGMPPMPMLPPPPDFERVGGMIHVIDRMGEAVFNPAVAGVMAVGALKEELHIKATDRIETMESLLAETRTQGLRNALHLALKDLYIAKDDEVKAAEHLKAMVRENDEAMQQHPHGAPPPSRPQ